VSGHIVRPVLANPWAELTDHWNGRFFSHSRCRREPPTATSSILRRQTGIRLLAEVSTVTKPDSSDIRTLTRPLTSTDRIVTI
jgi:hypothetical protein